MKLFFPIALLWAVSSLVPVHAQSPVELEARILKLYKDRDFKAVIAYKEQANVLTDSSLYRIGRAYFYEEDTANAHRFFNLTLAKNPKYQNAWYFKSILQLSTDDLPNALASVNKALALDNTDGDYHSLKGDIFAGMDIPDSARVSYQNATRQKDFPLSSWVQIGDMYFMSKDYDHAATAYREALPKVEKDSGLYRRCFFNFGSTQYLMKDYEASEKSFKKMIDNSSDDYAAIAKLIQVYYAQKKYDKTKRWKDKLYDAWKAGKLPKRMKNDFCIDQFTWNGKHIYVYERFDESGDLYYKHVFYIPEDTGDSEYQIQTEYSFAIAMSGKKYVLGMDRGNTHYTYIRYLFDANPDYDELKEAVIKVLEGKVTPSSSSTYPKN